MGVLGRIPVSEKQGGRVKSSLRKEEGIGTRLPIINRLTSPPGYGGGIRTVVFESVIQMIEKQSLDRVCSKKS